MATVSRVRVAAVATATAVVTGACSDPSQPRLPTTSTALTSAPAPGLPPASRWERVLTRLDGTREAAYRTGDPALLRHVYLSGSPVLRRDRRLLAAYEGRGVRVGGVRLELLQVRLHDRDRRVVRLRVVDRLARPVAHTAAGEVALPQDLPTRRAITLVASDDGWRIAAVRRLAG